MEFSVLPSAPATNICEVFTIAKNVLKAAPASARGFRQRRQEHREQPDRRQERADLIDERDASVVGDLAEHRGAEPADTERDAEEHSGDHSEAMRHQFLREHDDHEVADEMMNPMNTVSTALAS